MQRKIQVITDLLLLDYSKFGNWQYRNFKGSGSTRIKLISQPQDELAVIRQDISTKDRPARPWSLRDREVKQCLSKFEGNLCIDLHCKYGTNEVFSLILKFDSGQIAFSAGNLYFRKVTDMADLANKFAKLEHLFPV